MPVRLSYRPAILIFTFSVTAALLVFVCRSIQLFYQGDPDFWLDITNFAVVLLPFAFSILFAFVPDMRTKHIAWRVAVVLTGVGFSWMLWKQQHLAMEATRRDQREAINTAVTKSNEHSDQQIANVREDVKGLKTDLDKAKGEISSRVNESESHINTNIAKVNKPIPPERGRLEFSLYPDNSRQEVPVLTGAIARDKDGNFPVAFFFKNTSGTSTEPADIWITVCDACSFAVEPSGFNKPAGIDEHYRHKSIGALNPGAAFEKTTIIIKTTLTPPVAISLGFTYSCKNCGKMADMQKVTISLLP